MFLFREFKDTLLPITYIGFTGISRGHIAWNHLNTPALKQAYADMLAKLDQTDTLIAIGEKQ